MSSERNQVLELLASGKVSADEAGQLLDRISAAGRETAGQTAAAAKPAKAGFMCVRVDTHEGDAVNVRIPLALVKSGIKLSALMPRNATEAMAKNGVDLSQLSALSNDDLIVALQAMEVDVVSHEGDKVKVYCEC